jgi:thiol:disulfide interchange protein DsbG
MMSRILRGALLALCLSASTAMMWPVAAEAAAVPEAELAKLFPALEKSAAIVEGVQDAKQARAVLYVFFDANCLYCHVTWKALQLYERVGLQVRWVPVAYQKDSSFGRAAAILAAKYPLTAFRDNETGYRAKSYDGGIKRLATVSAEVRRTLEANTALMNRFGVPATPALVWKDAKGRVRVSAGVPRENELPGMTGLPLQKYTDPELLEFRS